MIHLARCCAPAQCQVALRHGICPCYLGQELVRWADVVVGVNAGQNPRLFAGEAAELVAGAAAPYEVLVTVPDAFVQALQAAAGALSERFNQHPLNVGSLLNFHFELRRFQKLVEALSEHSLCDVQTFLGAGGDADAGDVAVHEARDAALCVRNVAPACFLRPRLQPLQSITLFSATLSPPGYAIRLLGLPENTAWIDVPPAFPAEHLKVRVAHGISTRYAHRGRSLQRLVAVIAHALPRHGRCIAGHRHAGSCHVLGLEAGNSFHNSTVCRSA